MQPMPIVYDKLQEAIELQKRQYEDTLFLEGEIEAESEESFSVDVTSLGALWMKKMTGSFSTLKDDGGGNIIDDGVCYLRAKLIDGATDKALTNDYVPLNLLLAPGHVKDATATNNGAIATPQIFLLPYSWEYIWAKDASIIMKVKNDSDVANNFKALFHGFRIKG